MSQTPNQTDDGRRLRAVRGKEAAIEALLNLYAEGRPYPTFSDIAERAGISERTLFRYFGSYDDFISSAAMSVFEQVRPFFTRKAVEGDLHTRLLALMDLRCKFIKQYGAMVRSVDVLSAEWTAAKQVTQRREELLIEQLSAWMGREKDSVDEDTFVVLHNLLGWQNTARVVAALGRRAPAALTDAAVAIVNAAGK